MARALKMADENFNPRSPRGERLNRAGNIAHVDTISIHVPREGNDKKSSL